MSEIKTEKRWDADGYHERFGFIWQYGANLLDLLDPQPGERILDLGCGTGQLTSAIAARGANVVGIDSSSEMVDRARDNFPGLVFQQADATLFEFAEPFDAVFSNAVLHWVQPPEAAVRRIQSALRPGGRLVAEFGGKGNVERVTDAIIEELEARGYSDAGSRHPWYFPSIAGYATLLEAQGLEPVMLRLYDRPTLLDGGEEGLPGWLAMFGDSFFRGLPATVIRDVVQSVAERLRPHLFRDGHWYADYRRLQVLARREDQDNR